MTGFLVMQGETHGADLLAIAEQTLNDVIRPDLEGDARIASLMVASAMRMVARELELEEVRTGALGTLYRHADLPKEPVLRSTPEALGCLRNRIRDGLADGDTPLHLALWEVACCAAGISKPSILVSRERRLVGLPEID